MSYVKPEMMLSSELAEGVYAASGINSSSRAGITWIKGDSEIHPYSGGSTKINQKFTISVVGDVSSYSQIRFTFSCDLKYVWGEPAGKLTESSSAKVYIWDLSNGNPGVITAQAYYEKNPVVDLVSAELL